MITMQNGEFKPVPFSEVIDPSTGQGKLRPVDIKSETYQVARDYMVRLDKKDFADEQWVERLASVAGLTISEFKSRFARFSQ